MIATEHSPLTALLGSTLILLAVGSVKSASAADYYAGKQIRIIVPGGAGGGYGLYGQLLANNLGRFIPGNPSVAVSYMPGAGGVKAMNYLFSVAPNDGTVIAILMQGLASTQALKTKGVKYDASKFNYIGRATTNVPVHMVWHSAGMKSIRDAMSREISVGAVGAAGSQNELPLASNALIGTKWKIISGYKGSSSTRIAMERGEVQAGISPATLFQKQLKPWIVEGKVVVVVQYADFRHPLFPSVPSIVELASDQNSKAVLKFLTNVATVGRALGAPPKVPLQTVTILRNAFDKMMTDPVFKKDADTRGAELSPMSGEKLGTYITGIVETPDVILAKAMDAIRPQ